MTRPRPPRPSRGVSLARALPGVLACAIGACNGGGDSDPISPPSSAAVVRDGVEFTADTRVMESFPVQLATTVTMRNTSSAPVTLELGSGCPVHLRAYRTEARTGLVWDQGRERVCTMQIQVVDLAPGASARRDTRTDAYEILGDSLPDGRYWLSAYVQVLPEGLTVPAGSVDLAVPR